MRHNRNQNITRKEYFSLLMGTLVSIVQWVEHNPNFRYQLCPLLQPSNKEENSQRQSIKPHIYGNN
jgi:hypothetical protein